MTDIVDGVGGAFGDERRAVGTSLPVCQNIQTVQSGITLDFENGAPVLPVESPARAIQLRVKRFIDIGLASGALLLLAPLLLSVALAIKLTSPGPVLYRQWRPGLAGRPFRMLKFRSMYAEACDDGNRQATVGDSRVTTVGRFIRATSIDELPQLWNVLIGEMSLVGPRPMIEGQIAAGRDYRELVAYYDFRFNIKPGLTGWAQCNGLRGGTENALLATKRIDHDCAYVQKFSLLLDAKILIRTLLIEFLTGTGV